MAQRGERPGRARKPAKARRRRRSGLVGALSLGLTLAVWGGVAATAVVGYHITQLPPIDKLEVPKRPPNIAILADDGALLANRGDTGGASVKLSDLPAFAPKAFVAIEDRRFYSHWGVDPIGVLRAATRNAAGGATQGGSTLTQQLAKNLFLTQERTFSRKIQEAILAVWLERKYSKNQILELYLNRVYFGSGAYGIEAASQRYFGHPARALTLPEAAMLAGLMKAPTKLAPNRNLKGAQERAAQVVAAMAEEGFVTPGMAQYALANPATPAKPKGAGSANYAADYVMDVLDDTIGAVDEDIVVTTTISARLQAAGEAALTQELDAKGAKFGVEQGALVSIEPNGAIKALIGGRNYADSQFNRATAAKRQPGSAFKPFVYLAALEHGLTPASVRDDAPINVRGWTPENYSRQYFGPVTLTKALSLSLNTVAVRLGLEVGPKAVINAAHRLGIESELTPNASIALGTSEVTPLELVSAYAPFANGGVAVEPFIILRVKTAAGKLLYQRKSFSNGRAMDAAYVPMMNAMMQETLLTGTARKGELPGWQAAGKTGTSQDFRDAWFVGYTARLVTGVWLGNDDNSPTKKASGGNLPVEIWSRYMRVAHQGVPPQPLPGGIWRAPEAAPSFWPGAGQDAAPVEVAPPPPVAEAGAPGAPSPATGPAPAAQQPRRAAADPTQGGFAPPGLIPTQGRAAGRPPAREKNFFESLFGG
ncbi:transglycosylase domain-containing protein [Methylocella sp.]|uniref:transglycosylase domain-containing protein n=1 Tax=Methylocella sp. TaxID=1978226 RepID=UPI00378512BF